MYKLQIIAMIHAIGLSIVTQNDQRIVCQSLDKKTTITIRTKKYGNSCHVSSLKKIQTTSNLDEKKLKNILMAIAAPHKKKLAAAAKKKKEAAAKKKEKAAKQREADKKKEEEEKEAAANKK